MNLELPNPHEETADWFSDIEAIAVFAREIAEKLNAEIVIGIADTKSGVTDDLFHIDSGPIDIERLKAIIGVAPN